MLHVHKNVPVMEWLGVRLRDGTPHPRQANTIRPGASTNQKLPSRDLPSSHAPLLVRFLTTKLFLASQGGAPKFPQPLNFCPSNFGAGSPLGEKCPRREPPPPRFPNCRFPSLEDRNLHFGNRGGEGSPNDSKAKFNYRHVNPRIVNRGRGFSRYVGHAYVHFEFHGVLG